MPPTTSPLYHYLELKHSKVPNEMTPAENLTPSVPIPLQNERVWWDRYAGEIETDEITRCSSRGKKTGTALRN